MTGFGSRLGRAVARMTLGVIAAATAAALMAPPVFATPDSDASNAINQSWQAAGGDESSLGSKDGDVYQVGDGYAQNFTGGRIYFTPATGAHLLYGAILDKFQTLGGPGDSDLGFPTIDEVTGLVGPDSRVSTFSATDKPAIFWTPDTGAWVVRGAMNIAWDKLGGSAGTLGVPVEDESYNGDVISQKFTGGEVSWNQSTKSFTTVPEDLASQLDGVVVPTDATSAINLAWRAAGGLAGSLGARQGPQSSVGDNGAAQAFAGGKIFYSPGTGAHAVTGAILSKYESLGGPTGDLGLPVATEADGGAPNSRVTAFSATDKPVIFWTPDNGAIVVRGAINAAWAKLGGASGKLGVPISSQSADGDTVTQKFNGGEVSWNESTNQFSTKPAELAASLSGLDVPKGPPGSASNSKSDKGFSWHWWWLLVIIPVLLLIGVVGLGVMRLQRRRAAAADGYGESGFDDDARWPSEAGGLGGYDPRSDEDTGRSSGVRWGPAGASTKTMPGPEDVFDGDQDSVDTTPTRIPAAAGFVDEHRPHGDNGDQDARDTYGDYGHPDDRDDRDDRDEYEDHEDSDRDDYSDRDDEESSGSGRHSAIKLDDPDSMWSLSIDDIRAQLHRRAAAEAQPDDQGASSAQPDGEEFDDDDDDASDESFDEDVDESSDDDRDDDDDLGDAGRPAIHLPLADPYRAPEGYPIKANTHSGLYYTPDCDLYDDTVPEVWFASEELAQANGFVKAE